MLVLIASKGIERGLAWIKYSKKDIVVTFFLLPPGVPVDQASRSKEKGSNYRQSTSKIASNQQLTHLRTPILNCFAYLLWAYVISDSEFSCFSSHIMCLAQPTYP